MAQETAERFNPSQTLPIITHGLPYPEALSKHLRNTLHCSRPFIIISTSLAKNTDALDRLKTALEGGDDGEVKIAGVRVGMKPHTYYSEVLEVVSEVKAAGADCIITLGGGSLTDGAKAIVLIIANPVSTLDEMHTLFTRSNAYRNSALATTTDPALLATVNPPTLRILTVPTTLSAGEYNPAGGATHDDTQHKQVFYPPPPAGGPAVLVLDPQLALGVPARVWLGTGLRALDHCVETVGSGNMRREGTEASLRGARALVRGLLGVKKDGADERARLECLLGAAESMKASVIWGVHVGGSHGIGHQLGPMGVPHAETTCVCLPAVQKYNAKANAAQQALVLQAFWDEPDIADVLTKRGLVQDNADLGDALDAIIRELGLPRTLGEYGIGRDRLGEIAERSVKDVCCGWNVIPLVKEEQVLEILEMCVGD